jgi:hypothetical protein
VDNKHMNADRIDLGGMVLVPKQGIDVQVQADQETGVVSQVTLTTSQAAAQVQPYAAPKSGGMWDEIRSQIMASVTSQGGLAEIVAGSFGQEIMAQLPQQGGSMQPLRFTALEGPRWLLRVVYLGSAARSPEAAKALEEMVRDIEVVRGDTAMPSGAPIPLRLPTVVEAPSVELPNPFERGPEISEVR